MTSWGVVVILAFSPVGGLYVRLRHKGSRVQRSDSALVAQAGHYRRIDLECDQASITIQGVEVVMYLYKRAELAVWMDRCDVDGSH
jgi:hypothetical protein